MVIKGYVFSRWHSVAVYAGTITCYSQFVRCHLIRNNQPLHDCRAYINTNGHFAHLEIVMSHI